jgi:hypothetical protein
MYSENLYTRARIIKIKKTSRNLGRERKFSPDGARREQPTFGAADKNMLVGRFT